jgi:hypothetical protein
VEILKGWTKLLQRYGEVNTGFREKLSQVERALTINNSERDVMKLKQVLKEVHNEVREFFDF